MNNIDEFLNLYNKLESLLKIKYGSRADSPIYKRIMELKNSKNGLERSLKLDTIRNIRNFYAHGDLYSKEFISINNSVFEFLNAEINLLANIKTAYDIMIPFDKMFYCNEGSNVVTLINEMRRIKHSCAPIISYKKVVGVFTENSFVTNRLMRNNDDIIIKSSDYPLDLNSAFYFDFVASSATVDELEDIFSVKKNNKRLKMLFVTKNGFSNENVLGIITVYDVIENN